MITSESPALFSILLAALTALGLAIVLLLLWRRRQEMEHYEKSHRARAEAIERGSHKARLIHPEIDLSQCIGCGACVRACPEEGVLDLLHGQAVVVHGARCVGHGRCAEVCPAGAIALTFADLGKRTDLPAITEEFEAVDVPGLFIAGELTGFSLVRTAVSHGAIAADSAHRRVIAARTAVPVAIGAASEASNDSIDLLIVGVGPAGMSCALRAKELGLSFELIEQAEEIGGTVAAYPRKKMVMTQPMMLPLHGRLTRLEYLKEDLVDLWKELIALHSLPVRTGVRLKDLARDSDGIFTAQTSAGVVRARTVCLALGRRGTPRKLGVPGEELPKVLYNLLDAESYQGRRILVVGGGDSAAEAAIGLAEQPGNIVTLSARGRDLSRIKSKNDARLKKSVQEKKLQLLLDSNTTRIDEESVTLRHSVDGVEQTLTLPNDDLFVFIGGDPPFELLKRAGVSFDPARRPKPAVVADSTTPLIWATSLLLLVAIGMLVWASLNQSYYGASPALRTMAEDHRWLRPSGAFGLTMALAAVGLFLWNLAYLARKNRVLARVLPGSLRFWMGSHVFTGIASFLCVIVHAGFNYRMTLGGYAFVALGVVLIAGMIGRYFYAAVPHAANGRELDLEELRARLASLATTWDKSSRGLGSTVRERIESLIRQDRWHPSLFARIVGLGTAHLRIRRALRELRLNPDYAEVPAAEREELMELAKRSLRLTVQIAHFEELRALLGSWRFFHRWLALLMLLLVLAHIAISLRYAKLDWPLPAWVLPSEKVASR